MKLFSRRCEFSEAAYLIAADRLGPRERVALEVHAATCVDCADALRNSRGIDTVLRDAFAPLRERRTIIAPGRVRLAVGPRSPATNPWLRAPRFFGRLAEVTVMVGVTVFAVSTTFDPSAPQATTATPATHSVIREYFRAEPQPGDVGYPRWLRLNRLNDVPAASDQTRLPDGRFDGETVDTATGVGSAPR